MTKTQISSRRNLYASLLYVEPLRLCFVARSAFGTLYLCRAKYSQYWSEPVPNCVDDPELIVQYPYSIRSTIWFWMKYKVYGVADKGATHQVVAKVTQRVNGGNNGLKERQEAFDVAYPAFK